MSCTQSCKIRQVRGCLCSSPLVYNLILVHVMNTELQDQTQDKVHDQAQDPLPQEPLYYPLYKFNLGQLRELFQEDKVEFGQREIALKLIHTGNSLASINQQRLRDLGADIIFQEQYDNISQL